MINFQQANKNAKSETAKRPEIVSWNNNKKENMFLNLTPSNISVVEESGSGVKIVNSWLLTMLCSECVP